MNPIAENPYSNNMKTYKLTTPPGLDHSARLPVIILFRTLTGAGLKEANDAAILGEITAELSEMGKSMVDTHNLIYPNSQVTISEV